MVKLVLLPEEIRPEYDQGKVVFDNSLAWAIAYKEAPKECVAFFVYKHQAEVALRAMNGTGTEFLLRELHAPIRM